MPLDNPFEPMIKNVGNYVSGTLYAQGVIPPIGITNYDGTAVASQADTHLLAAKDPVINEIAVGMSGNLIGENTVIGTPPLQLPDSAGYPLQGLVVALSPYQEGTGDPAPDNVRPILGTDKVTVWTGGENWSIGAQYDKSAAGMSVTAQADGTAKFNNQATATFNYYWYSNSVSYSNGIWLPAGKYTYSVRLVSGTATTVGGGFGLFYWYTDSTGTRLNTQKALSFPSSNTVTFPKDVRVQPVIYFDTNAVCTDAVVAFMIERGETASDHYIPYVAPSQTVITLPQTVYTGTIGSEGGESRWGEVDLGTLTWEVNSEEAHIFMCNPPNIKPVASSDYAGRNKNAICEAYKPSTTISISSNMDDMSWLRSITQYFVRDTNYSTLSDFVASVSGVKLIYELETPVQFAVPSVTIPTPKGTATTWATAEDGNIDRMSVSYIRNE